MKGARIFMWVCVVGFLGLVLLLALPVAKMDKVPASKTMSMVLVKNIEIGIKNFYLEYKNAPAGSEDVVFSVGQIIRELLGEKGEKNFRGLRFVDFSLLEDGRGGLIFRGEDSVPWVADAWGAPVRIICDVNQDGKVPRPFEKGFIEKRVIVWSPGKDGIDGTQDDVRTW